MLPTRLLSAQNSPLVFLPLFMVAFFVICMGWIVSLSNGGPAKLAAPAKGSGKSKSE
jgi:hypothetical protein